MNSLKFLWRSFAELHLLSKECLKPPCSAERSNLQRCLDVFAHRLVLEEPFLSPIIVEQANDIINVYEKFLGLEDPNLDYEAVPDLTALVSWAQYVQLRNLIRREARDVRKG